VPRGEPQACGGASREVQVNWISFISQSLDSLHRLPLNDAQNFNYQLVRYQLQLILRILAFHRRNRGPKSGEGDEARAEARRAESGGGVLEEGAASP